MKEDTEKVQILREWISKQPHLPQKNKTNLLRRFLHCSNDSIELAKQTIDFFYTLRCQVPEVFTNRDPDSPELQEIFENIQFLPIPKFTKENYQIFVYRLLTSDADKYDFILGAKAFTMVADARMVDESQIADGEVPIFDMNNFTAKHLTKIVFPVMKKMMSYSQEAHPMKLKAVHFVNAPSFVDKFLMLIKPFVKSDILKSIHFHQPNSETLFEYVPRDLLPEEYGGSIGKCDDISKKWRDLVAKYKDYLNNDEYWKVDETKRPAVDGTPNSQYGIQGSFKTLSID